MHVCMWVTCEFVQKFDWGNVLPTVFFFMCVPRVVATFPQIFIPRVKHSWSHSPVYSPVLSLPWLSYWPFFITIWSGRREGIKRARGQKESKWAWSEVRRRGKSARRKPVWMRGKRVFGVMDDLSSCRNQKPNLPSPVLAKAHSAVMQGGPLG